MSKFSHYNYNNSTSDRKNQDSELFYKDLNTSKSLLKIERSKLNSNNKKDCSYLKNFKIVGSYNWKDDSTGTDTEIIPNYGKKISEIDIPNIFQSWSLIDFHSLFLFWLLKKPLGN